MNLIVPGGLLATTLEFKIGTTLPGTGVFTSVKTAFVPSIAPAATSPVTSTPSVIIIPCLTTTNGDSSGLSVVIILDGMNALSVITSPAPLPLAEFPSIVQFPHPSVCIGEITLSLQTFAVAEHPVASAK